MPLDFFTIEETHAQPILTTPATTVNFPLSKEDKTLIEKMKETVLLHQGVGLAAPQVGIAKKIIVYVISEDATVFRENAQETVPLTVLINPEYQPAANTSIYYDWEGCFSVKKTVGTIPRYDKIIYKAQTIAGEWFEKEASGFTARVLQHEIDHLNGILIIHRFTQQSQQGNPEEMMLARYKKFNSLQQQAFKKMLAEQENVLAAYDKEKAAYLAKIKALLERE